VVPAITRTAVTALRRRHRRASAAEVEIRHPDLLGSRVHIKTLYQLPAPTYFTSQKAKRSRGRSTGHAVCRGTQITIDVPEMDIFKAARVARRLPLVIRRTKCWRHTHPTHGRTRSRQGMGLVRVVHFLDGLTNAYRRAMARQS
jgi:hypothetical protein